MGFNSPAPPGRRPPAPPAPPPPKRTPAPRAEARPKDGDGRGGFWGGVVLGWLLGETGE